MWSKGADYSHFYSHKIVETGEGKGLSRTTFNYHLFCRNVGRKWVVSSNLCYRKIVRIWELKGYLEPLLITIKSKKWKEKGLPQIALSYNQIGWNEGVKGSASNYPLLPQIGRNGGRKGTASNHCWIDVEMGKWKELLEPPSTVLTGIRERKGLP
jgi:hypothetical protein